MGISNFCYSVYYSAVEVAVRFFPWKIGGAQIARYGFEANYRPFSGFLGYLPHGIVSWRAAVTETAERSIFRQIETKTTGYWEGLLAFEVDRPSQ